MYAIRSYYALQLLATCLGLLRQPGIGRRQGLAAGQLQLAGSVGDDPVGLLHLPFQRIGHPEAEQAAVALQLLQLGDFGLIALVKVADEDDEGIPLSPLQQAIQQQAELGVAARLGMHAEGLVDLGQLLQLAQVAAGAAYRGVDESYNFV